MLKKSYSRVCNLYAAFPLLLLLSTSLSLSIIFQINWLAFVKQFPVRNSNCISKQQGQHTRAASAKRRKGEGRGKEWGGGVVGITLEFSHIYLKFATHMHKQMGRWAGREEEDARTVLVRSVRPCDVV